MPMYLKASLLFWLNLVCAISVPSLSLSLRLSVCLWVYDVCLCVTVFQVHVPVWVPVRLRLWWWSFNGVSTLGFCWTWSFSFHQIGQWAPVLLSLPPALGSGIHTQVLVCAANTLPTEALSSPWFFFFNKRVVGFIHLNQIAKSDSKS